MGNAEPAIALHQAATVGRAPPQLAFPIMFVGDTRRSEFREAAVWLEQNCATLASDIQTALQFIERDFYPAVVIFGLARPGDVSDRQVEQLRSAAPLARLIALLGPWLEGETRTGKPLVGVPRIYWHQWPRLVGEIEKLERDTRSIFSLPPTAQDDERWRGALESNLDRGSIAIVAKFRETALALADTCGQYGWRSHWLRYDFSDMQSDFNIILLDAVGAAAWEIAAMARLHKLHREIPIVVLQGFPRTGDVQRWKQAGAAAVIAKPFLAADLLTIMDKLVALWRHSASDGTANRGRASGR